MKILKALILSLSLAGIASAQVVPGGGSGGGLTSVSTGVVIASGSPYNVVPGFLSNGATVTNGSATVTTGTNDPACVSGTQVGWAIFATKNSGANGLGLVSNPLTMAEGTISSCTAHSIVSSTSGNANASGLADGTLIWGPIMDTQLTSAETAAFGAGNNPCQTLLLPVGLVLVHSAHFLTATFTCVSHLDTGANTEVNATVMGWGYHNSQIVPTPSFSFATCTGGSGGTACFGMPKGVYYHDFGIWGGNNGGVGLVNANIGVMMDFDDQVTNVFLGGWMSDDANFTGLDVAQNGQYPITVINDSMGGIGCQVEASASFTDFVSTFCGDNRVTNLNVFGKLRDFGGAYGYTNATFGQIRVQSGTYRAFGITILPSAASNALRCEGTSLCIINGLDYFTPGLTNASTFAITGSGHIIVSNSSLQPGPTGFCMNTASATALYDDMGGNNCTNAANQAYSLVAGATVRVLVPGSTYSNPPAAGNTSCASLASPAVCAAHISGAVNVAASATTVVVNTTSVQANSTIILTEDSSLGTKLGVTCNTTPATALTVTARSAGVSFTISTNAPTTNPRCINWKIEDN